MAHSTRPGLLQKQINTLAVYVRKNNTLHTCRVAHEEICNGNNV